ncbi:MAG: hypothetical protein ABIF17_00390 [Patescibacteria group bacterium]
MKVLKKLTINSILVAVFILIFRIFFWSEIVTRTDHIDGKNFYYQKTIFNLTLDQNEQNKVAQVDGKA